MHVNLLSASLTKWSNTLKQLSVFDHFVGLVLKGLTHFLPIFLIVLMLSGIL